MTTETARNDPGAKILTSWEEEVSMWEPVVIIALVMGAVAILSNVLSVTVFVVRLGGKIDLNNSTVIGKIDVIDLRVKGVETGICRS